MVKIGKHRTPVLVYLDTSDYSRFGDVIRGKADSATESLFNELLALKKNGVAQFAFSAAILSELFQFNPEFPGTTQSKAEAVERLCGEVAFYWPMRSIAHDVALHSRHTPADKKPLSLRSEWFPSASEKLADFRGTLEAKLASDLASKSYSNRKERRSAEAKARNFPFEILASPIIDLVASSYNLDRSDVKRAITPTLKGNISSLEGSRRMFDAIARPTSFVRSYFSDINEDQSLPTWISDVGVAMQKSLIELRENLRNFDKNELSNQLPAGIDLSSRMILHELARQAEPLVNEFAPRFNSGNLFRDVDQLLTVPALNLFFNAYRVLVEQAAGMHGDGHDPERSAFGDLFHLLYLPHSDLWRCDRRFRNVVSKVCGVYDHAVVNRLSDLPAMIASLKIRERQF